MRRVRPTLRHVIIPCAGAGTLRVVHYRDVLSDSSLWLSPVVTEARLVGCLVHQPPGSTAVGAAADNRRGW